MKKKYTIKDIADACGVSSATVSYVLNDVQSQSIREETKKKILHYANMVGYSSSSSARALATGRTNVFGLYNPHVENSAGKHRLIRALSAEAERCGYQLRILTDRCLQQQVTEVDAIFALDISEEDFHRLGENTFAPLLYLDGQIGGHLFYSISFDAAKIRRAAIDRSGCRKVALVCPEPHCEAHAAYLRDTFDQVILPGEALSARFPEDTAVLLANEAAPVCAAHMLVLGSEALPLPFEDYVKESVSLARKTIARGELPREHLIRI